MSHFIVHDPKENLITVTIQGKKDLLDLIALGLDIARLVKKSGCTVLLIDILEGELVLSLLDVNVFLGTAFKTIHAIGIDFYTLRQALLAQANQTIPQILETIGTEHGLKIRVFQDREEARAWLKNETPENELQSAD